MTAITDTTGALENGGVYVSEQDLNTLATELELTESNARAKRIADRDNIGWKALYSDTPGEYSKEQLLEKADQVRAFSQLNPLMKRAKIVRAGYVFGDGISIEARSTGEPGTQDIATVVEGFTNDPRNMQAVFSTSAQHSIEHDLFDDGNVFLGHWVNPMTGAVQVRKINFEQITKIKHRSGDTTVPQFYLREWTENDGYGRVIERKAWYPDLRHAPVARVKTIDGHPVMWPGKTYPGYGTGATIYHLKVNPLGRHETWGLGDGYAALPMARAYTVFIENWAGLMNSLSKIAYHFKGTGGQDQISRAAAQAIGGAAGGASFGNFELETPNISGATFDANSGRPLAAQVASALGLPVTILTADPGPDSSRAVAQTLNRPQQNEMKARQRVHASYYRAACEFVISQAVHAPRGPLKGRVVHEDEQRVVVFTDKTDPTVDVVMPNLEEHDIAAEVQAIAVADATGKMPPKETLRLLLHAFNFDDVSGIIDTMVDDDGNFIDPAMSAANVAVAAYRRGENPAEHI